LAEEMDQSMYGLEDLVLAAIKAEIEAKAAYATVAGRVENAFLKDRLRHLAGEEEKHRQVLENVYERTFPGKEPVPPETSPVPMPELVVGDEMTPISAVLESAMVAELAANKFYSSLAKRFDDPKIQSALLYFSLMEMSHYTMLSQELEQVRREEEFEEGWEFMHAGP